MDSRHGAQVILSVGALNVAALDHETDDEGAGLLHNFVYDGHLRELSKLVTVSEAWTVHQEQLFLLVEGIEARHPRAADGFVTHFKDGTALIN